MSGEVNSKLPDEDALAAFATSALGTRRRRNRQQEQPDDGAPTTKDTTTPAEPDGEAPASPPAPAPASQTDAPPAVRPEPPAAIPPAAAAAPAAVDTRDPQPAEPAAPAPATPASAPAGESEAAVPHPTAAPDNTAEVVVVQQEQPRPDTPTGEMEVRAVTVPVTRTPVPPGLQHGRVIEVQVPNLGPSGARPVQCTVMVSNNVRDRFARYQLEKKMAGEKEPSNAMVVRRAFLHAKKKNLFGEILADVYHRANAVDEEDYDEDGLLGEVVGRRTVRGRTRDSGQQSFRPSEQELATYDAFCMAYGFPDRSAFMEGLLDRFLPQLPTSGRRR